MRILLIEDNAGFAGDLEKALREIQNVTEILTVGNKTTALDVLAKDFFDLVVLDLSIPPEEGANVPEPEHGQTVFYEIRTQCPGTPIFILTGSEADKFSRTLARLGNQVQLWGCRVDIETVAYFLKEEVNELVDRVKTLAVLWARMSAVALNTRGKDLGLSAIQVQMLKSYANSLDCIACDISLLSGGLSGAKVVKTTAIDRNRKPQALCAAKLGERGIITAERDAYENHVRKLGVGACPPLCAVIDEGVGGDGAIFYTLTDDDTLSLFERLAKNPKIGEVVVGHVRESLRRWSEAATADIVTVGAIRARMISDSDAGRVVHAYGLEDLQQIESIRVQAQTCCIHGDLHCGNVLVKSSGQAVVIDFGDAGPGFAALDPIALELSLVFHPDAGKLKLCDGLLTTLANWPDVDGFAGSDPLHSLISACRNWSHDIGGGDLAVLACAYAYGLRQLKYDTVERTLTIAFLRNLADRIRAS